MKPPRCRIASDLHIKTRSVDGPEEQQSGTVDQFVPIAAQHPERICLLRIAQRDARGFLLMEKTPIDLIFSQGDPADALLAPPPLSP
jgi:hypothetical protein